MNRSDAFPLHLTSRFVVLPPTEFILATILLLAGWYGVFCDMGARWFPALHRHSLALMDRLTGGDSYYTHGPLVALASVIIAATIYRRHGLPAGHTVGSRAGGWILLIVSLLLHLLSVHAGITFTSGFAFIGVIAALVLLRGGWPMFRVYAGPIVLLVFMVPLPMAWIADLNFHLKSLAGQMAVWIASEIFRTPAILDGSVVLLAPSPSGDPRSLMLENACSGLRSLVAATWIVSLLATISPVRRVWKGAFILMSLPLAVGGNIVRMVVLILAAHQFGPTTAGPQHWLHNASGIAMFLLIIWSVMSLERIVPAAHKFSVAPSAPEPDFRSHPSFRLALMILALSSGLSVLWSVQSATPQQRVFAQAAVPDHLVLNGSTFTSQDVTMDPQIADILQTTDLACRRYTDPITGRSFELLTVFSPDNRKAIHPPEVCLQANGQELIHREIQQVTLNGVGSVTAMELITRRGTQLNYCLYTYKCGDHYTPHFTTQQASILLSGVTHRRTTGGLIRLTVPVVGRDVDQARALALEAVRAAMPHVARGLPQ